MKSIEILRVLRENNITTMDLRINLDNCYSYETK